MNRALRSSNWFIEKAGVGAGTFPSKRVCCSHPPDVQAVLVFVALKFLQKRLRDEGSGMAVCLTVFRNTVAPRVDSRNGFVFKLCLLPLGLLNNLHVCADCVRVGALCSSCGCCTGLLDNLHVCVMCACMCVRVRVLIKTVSVTLLPTGLSPPAQGILAPHPFCCVSCRTLLLAQQWTLCQP